MIQRFGSPDHEKNQYLLLDINILIGEVIIQSSPLWKDKTEEKGLSIAIIPKYGIIPLAFII